MDRDVVEVVAHFGDTMIDAALVGPGDSYRIGNAPTAHLAAPGLVDFPLVAGGTVRLPVGVPAVERAGSIVLSIGALSITITRARLRRAALARPRPQLRTPVFVAASLLVHLAVWLAAAAFAPFERLPAEPPPRSRLVRVADPPPPPPPPPAAQQRQPEPAAAVQPAPAARVRRGGSQRTEDPAHQVASQADAARQFANMVGQVDVERRVGALGPEDLYNEDDANERGFGGGRRFDPSKREGFGTVETGAYATMIYDVKLCPNKSCSVVGPVPALFVRTHLHHHMDAIYDCYAQHASGPGTIVLEFTITSDGAVRDARGSGLGETGACAARVAGGIFFKALGNDYDPPRTTRVRYPVRFQPSRG